MNKDRRKQIDNIRQRLAAVRNVVETIKTDLETIRDDEQTYRDNMPESFADSEKAQNADAAIDSLDEVINELEGLVDNSFDEKLTEASAA